MFSYYFFVRKSKISKKTGKCSIYLRIQNESGRKDISLKKRVKPSEFDTETQRVKNSTGINRTLNHIEERIEKIIRQTPEHLSLDELKERVFIVESTQTILELFREHNRKQLESDQVAKATRVKYSTIYKHLNEYLVKDIECNRVDVKLLDGFDLFLRKQGIGNNTTVKYLHGVRKIVRIALKRGYMNEYPFKKYDGKYTRDKPKFLTVEELRRIRNARFTIDRLESIRQLFLLACYTGLSYSDLAKLDTEDVFKEDGKWFIVQPRTKTKNISVVMLIEEGVPLIKSFLDGGLECISNQKFNSYLKEIADLCGIKKNLTVHVARHTFATTVTLNNGVPIETVQHMMGHKDLRSTQHYARVTTSKVRREMSGIKL